MKTPCIMTWTEADGGRGTPATSSRAACASRSFPQRVVLGDDHHGQR
jgi:hypothetical protein